MAGPMRFDDFRRKLESFGVAFKRVKGSSHWKLSKVIEGRTRLYVIPVHRNEVKVCYIRPARRRFGLLPEDGVSDAEFRAR